MPAIRFKNRDIHIVVRAALDLAFPTCPFCGELNSGESFKLTSRNGLSYIVTGEGARIDYCHIDARSDENGTNSGHNLFRGHHVCNQRQANVPLALHLDDISGKMTESEIRETARKAYDRAQKMMNGGQFDIELAKHTAKMIREGKPYRMGTVLKQAILSA